MTVNSRAGGGFRFIGRGTRAELEERLTANEISPWKGEIGEWYRSEEGDGVPRENEPFTLDHPAGYIAHPDLAEAVNTAVLLRKPLLLTGKPGTGKSELAERIAWEFNLGAVLRFEAQSLSEANDLFYRFDLVGQMAAAQLAKASLEGGDLTPDEARQRTRPEAFINFGPLGKAILRTTNEHQNLWRIAFPNAGQNVIQASPSVVLIDEIDKAGRDFPNDLLNGIQRLEFRIRELGDRTLRAAQEDQFLPIVIITSNSERDLPGPFLRRCAYFDIPDPDKETLRRILLARVFPEHFHSGSNGTGQTGPELPPLYEEMLDFFLNFRNSYPDMFAHEPGTSELIDWTRAVSLNPQRNENASMAHGNNSPAIQSTSSAVAKQREDRKLLLEALGKHLNLAGA
jgi:MoxR-like ATPase